MFGKKSFLRRLFNSFFGRSSHEAHSRKRSLQMESLEAREMLSVVGFQSAQDVLEGDTAIIRLERDDTAGQLTVHFSMDSRNLQETGNTSGLAKMGDDFETINEIDKNNYYYDDYGYGIGGSVTFGSGQKYVDIAVKTLTDSKVEGTEIVRLTLANAQSEETPYTVDQQYSIATVQIFDNTPKPTLWIETVTNGTEGGDKGTFVLKRNETSNTLTVGYSYVSDRSTAKFDTDITIVGLHQYYSTGSVTFEAGQDTVNIDVNVLDNSIVENTETVTLRLAEPHQIDSVTQYALDLTRREATLLIHDNESAPNVWIDSVVNGSEPDSGGKFILKRSDTSRELTINFRFDQYNSSATYSTDFTIPGLPYEEWYGNDPYYWDYYAEPGTVTFAKGSDTAEIFVNVNSDQIIEKTETVAIRLSDPNSIDGVLQYTLEQSKREAVLSISNTNVAPQV
jgi:hypothetical protein